MAWQHWNLTFILDFTNFADDPNAPGVAHLYLADRAKHDEIAAEWTLRFAKWSSECNLKPPMFMAYNLFGYHFWNCF